MAVDSGAAETVIPHKLVASYEIQDTEASRAGARYASATGQAIPNSGEQRLPLITTEGTLRFTTFQAAPVAKPLGSAKRMCTSGHRVVFDDEGSNIQNMTSDYDIIYVDDGLIAASVVLAAFLLFAIAQPGTSGLKVPLGPLKGPLKGPWAP